MCLQMVRLFPSASMVRLFPSHRWSSDPQQTGCFPHQTIAYRWLCCFPHQTMDYVSLTKLLIMFPSPNYYLHMVKLFPSASYFLQMVRLFPSLTDGHQILNKLLHHSVCLFVCCSTYNACQFIFINDDLLSEFQYM